MAYTFEQPADDLLIGTFSGRSDLNEHLAWSKDLTNFFDATLDKYVYYILDIRQGDTSFGEMLGAFKNLGNIFNPTGRPNVQPVIVGNHSMAKFAAELARGSTSVPFFRTLEDAHEFIRMEREKRL